MAGSNIGGNESNLYVPKTYREIAIAISPNPSLYRATNILTLPSLAIDRMVLYTHPRQLTGGHYYTPTSGSNSLSYGIDVEAESSRYSFHVAWMAFNGSDKSHDYYMEIYAR